MRHVRWIVVPLIVIALAAHAPDAAARKRKPKESISAVVNGRRVKFARKLITTDGNATVGDITLTGAQVPRRLGRTYHSLSLGCAVALSGGVFPADGMFCVMSYVQIKFARPLVTHSWAGAADGVQVTVTSFDGTRIAGTFSGTLEPDSATDGPATVTDGTFDVLLNTP